MCCISLSGKSWNRSAMTSRSAVSSASSPDMSELPGSIAPVCGFVVMNTLHLNP